MNENEDTRPTAPTADEFANLGSDYHLTTEQIQRLDAAEADQHTSRDDALATEQTPEISPLWKEEQEQRSTAERSMYRLQILMELRNELYRLRTQATTPPEVDALVTLIEKCNKAINL